MFRKRCACWSFSKIPFVCSFYSILFGMRRTRHSVLLPRHKVATGFVSRRLISFSARSVDVVFFVLFVSFPSLISPFSLYLFVFFFVLSVEPSTHFGQLRSGENLFIFTTYIPFIPRVGLSLWQHGVSHVFIFPLFYIFHLKTGHCVSSTRPVYERLPWTRREITKIVWNEILKPRDYYPHNG